MALSHRLRSLIRWRGMTQKQFAAETGIPYQTLRKYLDGRSPPGSERVARLMRAQIDIGWLLTGENSGPFAEHMKGPSDFPGYGDNRFLKEVFVAWMLAADMRNDDLAKKGEPPLPWEQVSVELTAMLQLTIDSAERVFTRLEELGAKGPAPEELARLLMLHGEPPAAYWAWISAGGDPGAAFAVPTDPPAPKSKPRIKRRRKRKVQAAMLPEIPAGGWPIAAQERTTDSD